MKNLIFAALTFAVSSAAFASSSPLACADLQAQVRTEGFAFIDDQWFVSDASYCDMGQATILGYVHASDNNECLVGLICHEVSGG